VTPAAPRASSEERERLASDFVRLCEIESPSQREREVADEVARELRSCGLDVDEDDSAPATGSDTGNLLAAIPGPEGAPTVLFCAHLDTVPLDAPVEVVREEGVFRNAHEAILGADNKAAVVLLLALARRYTREPPPIGIELLLTTCEERSLHGAKELTHDLRSDYGFVFDHATPIGELVVAGPTYYRVVAGFRGVAAHAGIRPEDGRNAIAAAARAIAAMEIGRLDAETTTNVGTISGGTANNVVAERCRVELEVRSLDEDKAGAAVAAMVDAINTAATDAECDVEIEVAELFRGFRLARTSPAVTTAAAALEGLGIEPTYIATGGGSDANALIPNGIPVLNIANGTERNHQPDESVTVAALETALDVTFGLVDRARAAADADTGAPDGV
jgi:tripeptide aminopeptidase